jgi:chromosome segregation ATPase
MAEEFERTTVVERDRLPGWAVGTMVVLALVALGGLGMGWWATTYAQDSRQNLSSDIQTLRQGYGKDMDAVQLRLTAAEKQTADIQDDLTVVTKRMQITQSQLTKARAEAKQIREDDAKQLADMDTKVAGQLSAKANTEDVTAVSGQVGVVRTDLDATKTDLNDTKNNLQMARSELGTLIAKNHDEVDELRKLGERDYVEFTIEGKNKEQKVGAITVQLHSTNPAKSQYNVSLVVDDKRMNNKNGNINQPIFFYGQGNKRAPMEIVVNTIDKNKVSGYLSIPKVNQTVASASSSGSK